MKKLFSMLIVLFIIYFLGEIIINLFGKGHTLQYTITTNNNNFEISENYTANTEGETDSYYIEITINNKIFNIQTYYNLYGSKRIVKEVYYYKDNNYECIFPLFVGSRALSNVLCYKNGIMMPSNTIVDANVSKFVDSLTKYDALQFTDDKSTPTISGVVTVYSKNIIDGHYVAINNYKGIYTISENNLKKIYSVKLFDADVYKRPLSAVVGENYITANYDQKYTFDRFMVVNLTNNEISEIKTTESLIDHDAYVQGIVGDSLYIFDRENKAQYEIRISSSSIIQVDSIDAQIKYYQNGVWSRVSAYEAAKTDYIFENISHIAVDGYARVDVVGTPTTGYTYYYKKTPAGYEVYRSANQNSIIRTYLFSTNKISDVVYTGDFIYYSSGVEVKYYNDRTGNRTLYKNTELDFNSSLYFNVYKK